jgi:hypothetical protein
MNLPSVKIVEAVAFTCCINLADVKFGDKLESIIWGAFDDCRALKRITMPLRDGMITHDDIFRGCRSLASVDLVGDLHQTIAALHLEEWKDEMSEKIGRINQILPTTDAGTSLFDGGETRRGVRGNKAQAVRMWIRSVLRKIEDYKAEHSTLLKEASTTLELALWKSRLGGDNNDVPAEGDENGRAECRNNCGADMCIIIPNILSFLNIE